MTTILSTSVALTLCDFNYTVPNDNYTEFRTSAMHMLHEPAEDFHIAVHRNVDIFGGSRNTEVILEVSHSGEKQLLAARKVLPYVVGVVAHVNDDLLVIAARFCARSRCAILRGLGFHCTTPLTTWDALGRVDKHMHETSACRQG